MHFVYVLYSKKLGKKYIGETKQLDKRYEQHVSGNVITTSRSDDYKIVFYEAYLSKKDALRREKYLKSTKGKRALAKMLIDSMKLINS